jgi:hypothetical protein
MPALFIVLGFAVVVFIAAAGHKKHPAPYRESAVNGVVVEIDRGMPPSVVARVLKALGEESDPAKLDELGTSLGAHYPLAASELHAKAMMLRARAAHSAPVATAAAHPPALPPAHPAPAEPPPSPPPPQQPAADAAPVRQFDAAAVLQAAMRALVEETDPVVLDGFAESIRAPYPAAAEILAARARTLHAGVAPHEVSGKAPSGPTPATPAPPHAPSPEEKS